MIDAFVDVLLKKTAEQKAEDALTREILKLPLSDIQKIASAGSVKRAFAGEKNASDDSNDWLKKYEGTPLYDEAIALEEDLLGIEGERIKRRLDRPVDDDLWTREDMVRLKKRQLDLELSKDRGASRGEDMDDDDLESYLADTAGDSGGDTEEKEDDEDKGASTSSTDNGKGAPTQETKQAAVPRAGAPRSHVHQGSGKTASVSYMPSLEAADLAGRALAHALHKTAACTGKEKDSGFLGPAVDAISGGIKGFREGVPGGKLRSALIGGGGSVAGGLAGSTIGAGLGSALGPLGTLGGGLIGGALGSSKGYGVAQNLLGAKKG